jgi:hypothetical protein
MSAAWTSESLFYRQVNPSWLAEGVPSSQAFGPTPKDDDKLSVDDASKVSAEGSWRHFTETLGLRSVGTWAVSMGEVDEAGDLVVAASPKVVAEDPAKNNLAHCHVDFSRIASKGQKKKRAQHLAIKATERGCLFQPSA